MPEASSIFVRLDYIGELDISRTEDILLVESDHDYVRACVAISAYLSQQNALNIWVRKKNHFVWLRDFAQQVGVGYACGEKTARDILADEWKVSIPDWLDDATVLNERLLDLSVAAHSPDTFENRLLAHFFGAVFQAERLNTENVAEVMTALTNQNAGKFFEKYPSLERCLQSKCGEWHAHSSEKWAKDIAVRIPEKLRHVWKCLSSWSLLHTYPPKLLEFVLAAQDIVWISKVPFAAVAGIPVEPEARDELLTQIDVFFDDVTSKVKTREDFLKLLGFVTGHLLSEFKHIRRIIKSGQFKVQTEDIRKVKEIFRECPGVTASQLNMLDHCVMPGRPRLPAEGTEWSAKEWIAWTTKEYIPYRAWQVFNNRFDEALEAAVKSFSDWYVREYTAVHQSTKLSLVHSLAGIKIAPGDKQLILILVIDGLSTQFMGLMDRALRNSGFSLHGSQFRFAPLPTITERNKSMLLSGAWDLKEKNYESILKARAKSDWGDKKAVYRSSLKAFSDMQFQLEPSVIVLNCVRQ